MNHFSKETYQKITNTISEESRTDNWYDATYETYIRILEDNKLDNGSKGFYNPDDIVLAASFAFSWLARIPSLPTPSFRLDAPVDVIHHLYQIDRGEFNADTDKEVINELVSKLDNSVVAVSKMLHFLSPNYFSIIDSKVIASWNKLFPQHKLPKKIDINRYMTYAQLMRDWSAKSGIELRELEKALFKYQEN